MCIYLNNKLLFFSILVNGGRIFTLPLCSSVNILPLFTEIEKKIEGVRGIRP